MNEVNHPLQEKHRPKILYIVGGYPWPLDSGSHIRRYHVLLSLANYSDVDLLVFPPSVTDVPKEVAALCREVFVYPRNSSLATTKKSTFSRLMQVYREFQGWPLDDKPPNENNFHPHMLEVLKRDYDLIWIARLGQALRTAHRGGENVVLDLDDVEHLKITRMAGLSNKNPLKKLRLWIEARAWRISEVKALNQFACVVVCSEKDKKYLGNSTNIAIVPNGTRVCRDVQFTSGVPGRMLYVGTMGYWPNEDAVCHFINNILPIIRKGYPAAHLIVVGRCPSQFLKELSKGKPIQILGRVSEIEPYIADAALSVVPLRIGGGTRLKILESLACKTAVVSTSIGAEGLDLQDGHHISIADDPQTFAETCVTLLRNSETRRQLAEKGYDQVRNLYSWDAISKKIEDILRSTIQNTYTI